MNFCHLHNHDEYSLLDGLGTSKDYISRAKELGHEYVAITNHGNIDGLIKFQNEAKDSGICPIFGAELYIVEDFSIKEKGEKRKHITVLINSKQGWININKILTVANIEGFYSRPRVSPKLLLDNCEGLTILTACSSSFITEEWGRRLFVGLKRRISDNLFLEIMPHDYPDQIKLNKLAMEFSKEFSVPLVATNDCHYVRKGDEKSHEVLLAIQSKKKWKDPTRWKFSVDGLYLKSREEMIYAFKNQRCVSREKVEEALDNTIIVAKQCKDFFIEKTPVSLPKVYCGEENENKTDEETIRFLCEKGFREKVLSKRSVKRKEMQYRERLEEELEVIIKQGFARYFLIVWELVNWCNNNDIMVGPGRGSAGGSLICYLLNITAVDPIKHDLLFARFISPARIDLPDIDLDFEDIKRGRIFEHFKDIYGENNVAAVSTFSTMKGKGAVRDVSRVFDVPIIDVNAASSCIVVRSGGDFRSDFTIADAFETFEDGRKFKKKYPVVTETAIKLEGLARSKGQHAAAICISNDDLRNGERGVLVGGNKGELIVNWDKYDIEHVGLMKMDILGLSALTVLNETKKLVKKNYGVDIDYKNLSLLDKKVYEEFTAGNNVGIFQFGSLGLRKICREIVIDDFKILTHTNALFRPGTLRSGMVTEYIARKKGEKRWEHKHEFMEKITGDTLGIILYQEQVMKFMYDLGGLGWKTADTVRKVMSKSQGVEQFMKFKELFADGCVERKTLDRDTAEKLWDELASFGSYGFNKSHAVEYTLLAYWQMYCKLYYPEEFICASLTYGSDDKKEELIEEAIRLKIEVRPPKIGISKSSEWIIRNRILYCPFLEIKGIGEKTADKLLEMFSNQSSDGFFKGKKISEKFSRILNEVAAWEDRSVTQEESENISKYFEFSFNRDPYKKYRKVIERISECVFIEKVRDIDFSVIAKENSFYFGLMTEIKFGYRGKIDTLEKKLGISGSADNLGGVYGNFKDDSDFCMLVFSSDIYNRKKDLVEHSSGEFLIAKANRPSRVTSIQCRDAWLGEEIYSCHLDGLDLSLIKNKRFKIDEKYTLDECEECELRKQCKSPVLPSRGFKNIMIVGEAPGKQEDSEGIGFCGASGKYVWSLLDDYGLDRDLFHITNVVKCFPSQSKTPNKKQIKSCSKWIDEEIKYVNPVVILAFGNTCMEYFKGEEKGIMEMSGKTEWSNKHNAWICYCIHPASVLYHRENETLFKLGIDNFVRCINTLGLKINSKKLKK